ncbi:hypothetical protein L1987_36238 [Smallanthus sonchifolius]|uniref:Uncharacterized protein n=1 Tax=Smallanthus sonchifolius TaxID=185202 RepID=A0ACB9HDV6_9ASTR|nr:hypothetical protein L1987_36238 [Smallanthus sonchifolius]
MISQSNKNSNPINNARLTFFHFPGSFVSSYTHLYRYRPQVTKNEEAGGAYFSNHVAVFLLGGSRKST